MLGRLIKESIQRVMKFYTVFESSVLNNNFDLMLKNRKIGLKDYNKYSLVTLTNELLLPLEKFVESSLAFIL